MFRALKEFFTSTVIGLKPQAFHTIQQSDGPAHVHGLDCTVLVFVQHVIQKSSPATFLLRVEGCNILYVENLVHGIEQSTNTKLPAERL